MISYVRKGKWIFQFQHIQGGTGSAGDGLGIDDKIGYVFQ
jgi:hypothetical protein